MYRSVQRQSVTGSSERAERHRPHPAFYPPSKPFAGLLRGKLDAERWNALLLRHGKRQIIPTF